MRGACALLVALAPSGCNLILGLTDVPVPDDSGGSLSPSGTSADASADGAGGSSCGDTRSDAHNCGRCGHDCLGGLCSASACEPAALVPPGVSPWGLAQDATYLYWTDSNTNSLERTDKTTGATDVLNHGTTFFPTQVVLDDSGIYWGDATGVWRCPTTGCSLNPPVLVASNDAADQALVVSLAVDTASVFWVEGTGYVFTAAKGGTNLSATRLWAASAGSKALTTGVASDGTEVYFTATDGWLRTVPADGGATQNVGALNSYGSFGVAVDDVNVYWAVSDPSHGLIEEAPKSAVSPTTALASGQFAPRFVATDGTNVYWVADGSSAAGMGDAGTTEAVLGCSRASCAPTTLGSGYSSVQAIVGDDSAVYWTDNGGTNAANGAIWKLAK
jgi:hypothetical protein